METLEIRHFWTQQPTELPFILQLYRRALVDERAHCSMKDY